MSIGKSLTSAFKGRTSPPAAKPGKVKKRPTPLSVRLTDEERAELDRMAAGRSLGGFVRERLFDNAEPARTRGKAPVKDYAALAKALSLLGQSDLTMRLSALIVALESERLVASAEAECDIREARKSVDAIRVTLITALGLRA